MVKHMLSPNSVLIPDEDGLYKEATIEWKKVVQIGTDTYVEYVEGVDMTECGVLETLVAE